MDFLTFGLQQTLTIWVATGRDGYNNPTFAAPEERPCRWEQRNTKIQTEDGKEITARGRIFLDRDLAVGDYIFLGLSAELNPLETQGASRVMEFRKTPSIDGNSFERKAYI